MKMITTILGRDQAREVANSTWRMAMVMGHPRGTQVMAIQYNTAALLGTSDVTNAKTTKTKCGRTRRPRFDIFSSGYVKAIATSCLIMMNLFMLHISLCSGHDAWRTSGKCVDFFRKLLYRGLSNLHTTVLHLIRAAVIELCCISFT